MEQLVTIELFGQPYTFRTDSDVINTKEVADHLVNEINRIETQHSNKPPNVTKFTTLMLAALNIATENIELKNKHLDLLRNISKRSASLIRALDAAVNA
ncbi:MAG: cell division protein ZapA [Pseudomonadota bacterium]|uniref:Cell division protein ZapA n=1 Tax=Candidatus Desulfatibia profunda TaxID=2841695 RepID=A0A8J6TNP5_9BACT|nr:cell division protein ZapA [Candidatus Desulfatibia profunda]MBL7179363.1 cell division protein ZapA [Desulfobacterales bacterium]MBU0697918.1 cell division protein ZapA [Pseudomonadota bacterium]